MFFDPDTMDAQLNNPGWVRGSGVHQGQQAGAAERAELSRSARLIAAMAGGQVAEWIGWGDAGVIAADPASRSRARWVRRSCGSTEIWNYKTKQWDKFADVVALAVHGVRRLADRGAAGVENRRRSNSSRPWGGRFKLFGAPAITGGSGVNPWLSRIQNLDL